MCMASSAWAGDLNGSNSDGGSSNLTPAATRGSGRLDLASPSHHQPHVDTNPMTSLTQTQNATGKRVRVEGSRVAMSYPRKRAVTACELCRVRKRKCNNARPRCRFCEEAGVDCDYGDPNDHSSFDPASLVMIDKLNHIIRRLDAQQTQFADQGYDGSKEGLLPIAQGFDDSPQSQTQLNPDGRRGVEEFMEIPSSRTTADTILLWPIFEDKFPPEYLIAPLFQTNRENLDDGSNMQQDETLLRFSAIEASRPSFREHEVDELVEKFLLYVHIKNPILDVKTLKRYAQRVVEDGPGWDGGSCLVFLACALGALASPFRQMSNACLASGTSRSNVDSSTRFDRDLKTAESNYALAARRIGLLKNSIIRSQCYFWSGVYLMYTLRPVEAWEKFFYASSTFQIFLKGSLARYEPGLCVSSTRLLEQRLYWSCFKSECEIRVELKLPESSIANIKYPDMFPSPPNVESFLTTDVVPSPTSSELVSPSTPDRHGQRSHRERAFSESQKNSWYYYLSEIALRRIGNSVLSTFYMNDNYPDSDIPIQLMIKTANNFVDQMSQWYEGLPAAIKYNQEDYSELPQEELAHATRGRAFEIYTWLFRPFLYYAVHHAANDPHSASIRRFIDGALEIARATIEHGNIYHRHHGTWFHLRSGTSAALSMIAAHKCGHIELPPDWREVVRVQISALTFWERESLDIEKAKDTLTSLLMECETV